MYDPRGEHLLAWIEKVDFVDSQGSVGLQNLPRPEKRLRRRQLSRKRCASVTDEQREARYTGRLFQWKYH